MHVWLVFIKRPTERVLCQAIEAVEGTAPYHAIIGYLRSCGIEPTMDAIAMYHAELAPVEPWQSFLDLEIPCHILEDSYELVYGNGGHGGPHQGLVAARNRAKALLAGSASGTSIYIVPRSAKTIQDTQAIERVYKKGTAILVERRW